MIDKRCTVKKVADRGRPGAPDHAVELEIKIPRRDIFRVIVPFLVAMAFIGSTEDPKDQH